MVRVVSGAVNPPTTADFSRLTAQERARGVRLACQLRLSGDAEVVLEDPAPPSPWRSIPEGELAPPAGSAPSLERHLLGVAVDLGTTHLRVSLWDRRSGRRLAARHGPNPQAPFGADVLNRLGASREPAKAAELALLARGAIVAAVHDMLARDVGEEAAASAIGRILVVGNTAMLALLTGEGGEALLSPDNWERVVDCRPADAVRFAGPWGFAHAEVVVAPPVGGFIGSDLAADLLATHLVEEAGAALLVDLGTNTEVALWDGRVLRVTSVPGGPAFEGGVSRGMPAEPGAVFRVTRATPPGTGLVCHVLGGGPARGFCGTGLLDAVALMREAGVLKASGRFAVPVGSEGYLVDPSQPRTAVCGRDVDALQRAKAALAAAADVLLEEAGAGWRDVERLWVCGAFGSGLDVDHAKRLGLLPPASAERIHLFGGAALAGCEHALLSADPVVQLARATPSPRAINMSLVEAYGERFIQHLRLEPMAPRET